MLKFSKYIYSLLFFIPIIYVLMGSVSTLNNLDDLVITGNDITTDITRSLYVANDSNIDINVNNLPFIEYKSSANFGFDDRTFFYRYVLKNMSSKKEKYVIYFDNPTLDQIDVYEENEAEYSYKATYGDTGNAGYAGANKEPYLTLSLDPQEQTSIIFKVKTTGGAFFPVQVLSLENFTRYQRAIYFVWGAFIGAAILMSLYNLILYIGTNEKTYLFYIGYVLFFMTQLGALHGFNIYFLENDLYIWFSKNINVLNSIICIFTLKLALSFLRLEQDVKLKRVKLTKAFIYLLITCAVIFSFLTESQAALSFFVLQFFTYALVISLIVYRFKERIHWTKYYIFSWLPLFSGAAVGSMMFAGVLEYNFWNRHASLFGVMFEMALISMAIAEKVRLTEKERVYKTSHDAKFQLPNQRLLELELKSKSKSQITNYTVIILSFKKYFYLEKFLPDVLFKSLIKNVLKLIEDWLRLDLMLVQIKDEKESVCVATMEDGRFAFVAASSDKVLVSSVIDKVQNNQPLKKEIGGLQLEIEFELTEFMLNPNEQSLKDVYKSTRISNNNRHDPETYLPHIENKNSDQIMQCALKLQNQLSTSQVRVSLLGIESTRSGTMFGGLTMIDWSGTPLTHLSKQLALEFPHKLGFEMTFAKYMLRWVLQDDKGQHLHDKELALFIPIYVEELLSDSFTSFLSQFVNARDISRRNVCFLISHINDVKNCNRLALFSNIKNIGFNLAVEVEKLDLEAVDLFKKIDIEYCFIKTNKFKSDQVKSEFLGYYVSLLEKQGFKTVCHSLPGDKLGEVKADYSITNKMLEFKDKPKVDMKSV